jgi:metal-responsive CopG/Arc/MetJ family transcriptional regulator
MANVKTAISLQKRLFERADALAQEMNIPRSRLFALALEEFLERHDTEELLERINAACQEGLEPSDERWLNAMREHHRRLVEGEW